MRVRVVLDITKPLMIDKKVRQPDGAWLRGRYRYEKLPTFCFLCGRIGHVERHCAVYYQTEHLEELIRKWDASLRAEPRKPLVASGGAQWLVQPPVTNTLGEEDLNRAPLQVPQLNRPNMGRMVSRSVVALRRNLGVSLWRPVEEVVDVDAVEDDGMEGVELQDDKKRRRGGVDGAMVGVMRRDDNTVGR
ncbi:hypothetical protein LINGRAHAP2_LOCUS24396 [Linum grandiflorum]